MKFFVKLIGIVLFSLQFMKASEEEIIYVEYNAWMIYKTVYGQIFTAKQYRYEDDPFYFALENGNFYCGQKAQDLWEKMEDIYSQNA